MQCPLCSARKARRACPALGHEICAVCCGTKRLTEIRCPSDCVYLASSREHPAAAVIKRQQRDMAIVGYMMRDFNRRQADLCILVSASIAEHQPAVLQPLVDDDVEEAVSALAATFETAERGVIYEHRPTSLPAERLLTALKGTLQEVGQQMGAGFGADSALVLRRLSEAIASLKKAEPDNRRAFLDLLGRVIRRSDEGRPSATRPEEEKPRLILP